MHEARFRAMGSECQVVVLGGGGDLPAAAEAEVRRLEALWTRFAPDSETSRLNAQAGRAMPVSASTQMLVRRAIRAGHITGGRFDPLMGNDIVALGYDRTFGSLPVPPDATARVAMAPAVRPAGAGLRLDDAAAATA